MQQSARNTEHGTRARQVPRCLWSPRNYNQEPERPEPDSNTRGGGARRDHVHFLDVPHKQQQALCSNRPPPQAVEKLAQLMPVCGLSLRPPNPQTQTAPPVATSNQQAAAASRDGRAGAGGAPGSTAGTWCAQYREGAPPCSGTQEIEIANSKKAPGAHFMAVRARCRRPVVCV
jgi:hypothetical protein